jgi:hypothetical protein
VRLSVGCSARGLRTQILMPDSDVDTTLLLQTSSHPLAVIVDLQCELSGELIQMVLTASTDSALKAHIVMQNCNRSQD